MQIENPEIHGLPYMPVRRELKGLNLCRNAWARERENMPREPDATRSRSYKLIEAIIHEDKPARVVQLAKELIRVFDEERNANTQPDLPENQRL